MQHHVYVKAGCFLEAKGQMTSFEAAACCSRVHISGVGRTRLTEHLWTNMAMIFLPWSLLPSLQELLMLQGTKLRQQLQQPACGAGAVVQRYTFVNANSLLAGSLPDMQYIDISYFCMQVGATILARTLSRLPKIVASQEIISGLEARDDAAIIRPQPPGHVLIQTVDFFSSFISDPFIFGAVAANNALGVQPSLARVSPANIILTLQTFTI